MFISVRINARTSELAKFYDSAASSFDRAYQRADVQSDSDLMYNRERDDVENTISRFGRGRMLDLGAGTGYWLTHYLPNVDSVVLVEPSANMRKMILARDLLLESRRVIEVRDGSHDSLGSNEFDAVLLSGVLGHFDEPERDEILQRVCNSMRPGGDLLIVDSMWNQRAERLLPERTGYAPRQVEGQSLSVYKHYFLSQEIEDLVARTTLLATQVECGEYFWRLLATKSFS